VRQITCVTFHSLYVYNSLYQLPHFYMGISVELYGVGTDNVTVWISVNCCWLAATHATALRKSLHVRVSVSMNCLYLQTTYMKVEQNPQQSSHCYLKADRCPTNFVLPYAFTTTYPIICTCSGFQLLLNWFCSKVHINAWYSILIYIICLVQIENLNSYSFWNQADAIEAEYISISNVSAE